jgi:hypothetical protein
MDQLNWIIQYIQKLIKMNHNKENEAGYNEAPKFGPSEGNPPKMQLSFKERCRLGNYTPFNIENLLGKLSKIKKESYITQEEFEEFHNTIMDGLKIPRYV